MYVAKTEKREVAGDISIFRMNKSLIDLPNYVVLGLIDYGRDRHKDTDAS